MSGLSRHAETLPRRAAIALSLVASAYVAAQLLANVASLQIVIVAGLTMDAGTLIYPFTFTLRDLIHKTGGIAVARAVILAAGVLNLLMAVLFWIVSKLPPAPHGSLLPGAFAKVLSPVWRIVIASIIAQVVSELIDGEAYRMWVAKIGNRLQWTRVLTSNSVSVPIDSGIFSVLAFWGRMPGEAVYRIFIANVIIKMVVTLLSLPWIYFVKERDPKATQCAHPT